MSYGHYDPIARKDRCSKCCGDREIEKTSWADCVYKTSPSHHRNHRKCAEHWNLFIRNSKMIRCGGKVLVVLTLLCLLGLIFEGSSSSIVSESEKIHLGEEANIVMVRIYFSSGNSKIEISNEDSIGRFISVYREKTPDISEIYTSSFFAKHSKCL